MYFRTAQEPRIIHEIRVPLLRTFLGKYELQRKENMEGERLQEGIIEF
jgi:hypothetical protein